MRTALTFAFVALLLGAAFAVGAGFGALLASVLGVT